MLCNAFLASKTINLLDLLFLFNNLFFLRGQSAAHYFRDKLFWLGPLYDYKAHTDVGNMVEESRDSLVLSTLVGQYARLFEHGDTADTHL